MSEPAIARLAGSDGLVIGVAVDHRDALRTALQARGLGTLGDAYIGELKACVTEVLSPHASLMLLDVELGLAAVREAKSLAEGTALAVALEAQGYGALHEVSQTTVIAGWSAERAKAQGAAAVKLLLPFRTDRKHLAAAQARVAEQVIADCRAAECALILEPVVFSEPGETIGEQQFARLVVSGAEQLAALGPHVLKLQHPGLAVGAAQLHAACSDVPWVLLGGGAAIGELKEQITDACAAGARGFIVGRSLWSHALVADLHEARALLEQHALPALQQLALAARGERRAKI